MGDVWSRIEKQVPGSMTNRPFSGTGKAIRNIWSYINPSRYNTQETIKANKEMAEYEFEKNLEMWTLGNKYNSPEAQMERLRQAGLNPNLVYGGGSAPGNTTGQLPKYNAPNQQYAYEPVNVLGMLSQFQDFTMKQAQTNNIQEQNRVIKADANLKELGYKFQDYTFPERTALIYGKNELQRQQLKQREELFPYSLEYAGGKVKAQDLQRVLMGKQAKKLDTSIEYQNKVNDWYLTKMWSQIINSSMGNIGKILPAGQLGKAGKAVQSGMKPRYNSMESWRQAGY